MVPWQHSIQIRIELGLGRAPGTDPTTMRALRRGRQETEEQFPQDVLEILSYFADAVPQQRIKATPGQGTHVPVWLLGSSLFSAQLAAKFRTSLFICLTFCTENVRPSHSALS